MSDGDVLVNEYLHHERIERRQCRSLEDSGVSAEERAEDDHRKQQFPLPVPQWGGPFSSVEGNRRPGLASSSVHGVCGDKADHQDTGQTDHL